MTRLLEAILVAFPACCTAARIKSVVTTDLSADSSGPCGNSANVDAAGFTCAARVVWVQSDQGKTAIEAGNQVAIEYHECSECAEKIVHTDQVPPGCMVWDDGCNTCILSNDGNVGACTKRTCSLLHTPGCRMFKTMEVPRNCSVWFDGCNDCEALTDGRLACTRSLCVTLQTPHCKTWADGTHPTVAPTPHPTTLTTTTSTPRAVRGFPDRALTSKEAAEMLNKDYMGFDENDDNSPLGVTIHMAAQYGHFYKNIFCSEFTNPHTGTKPGCWLGTTDCRLSASLYNHKMLVSAHSGNTLMGLGRQTGFVLNQTLVQSHFGRCSYLWDGATNNKFNVGCGGGATNNCDDKHSAFHNICPSTGKRCTADDAEVVRGVCRAHGGPMPYPETHGGHAQCAIPGAAFNYHGQDISDWRPAPDNLRSMAKTRVGFNIGSDFEGPNIEKWNEVVIDERLLLQRIQDDPAHTILAIINTGPAHRAAAEQMRNEYCQVNGLMGKKCIPIVGVDANKGKSEGPFYEES